MLVCVYCSVIDFDGLRDVGLVIPAGDCFGLTFGFVVSWWVSRGLFRCCVLGCWRGIVLGSVSC